MLLVVGLLAVGLGAQADDPPAPSAPRPAAEQAERIARAEALRAQVNAAFGQGDYAKAAAACREELAVRELLGAEGAEQLAVTLNNLGVILGQTGELAEARAAHLRALALRERLFGQDSEQVAQSLMNLAGAVERQGDYAEGLRLLERARELLARVLGPEHPQTVEALRTWGTLVGKLGRLAEAEEALRRVLDLRQRTPGVSELLVADAQAMLATTLFKRGAYDEARQHAASALEIRTRRLGPEHPSALASLTTLAGVHAERLELHEAARLFERARALALKRFGPDHPQLADVLVNLGAVADQQGRPEEAREAFERALAIRERALGREHPDLAIVLQRLALMQLTLGEARAAAALLERALAITRAAQGETHPDVGDLLDRLGQALGAQGDLERAEAQQRKALGILEAALGPEHPRVAGCLTNLSAVLLRRGGAVEGTALLERAAHILEAVHGADSVVLTPTLNNLGGARLLRGEPREALALLERCVELNAATLGPDHEEVVFVRAQRAAVLGMLGRLEEAAAEHRAVLAATERGARRRFAALAAGERRSLLRLSRQRLDNWLNVSTRVGDSGYEEVLRVKGLVGRTEAVERQLVRSPDPEIQRLREALIAVEQRLAKLANEVPPTSRAEAHAAWRVRYGEAGVERAGIARSLTERLAPLREAFDRLDIGPGQVAAALAPDEVLVDLLRLPSRYVAWIVRHDGSSTRVELGTTEEVESAVEDVLDAIQHDADVGEAGQGLRRHLWGYVEANLGASVRRVVLCPDAALASVPFAALPGKAPGRWLADELELSWVMCAQDVVPAKRPPATGTGALLVGAVAYGAAARTGVGGTAPARRRTQFSALENTGLEVEALRPLLGATEVLVGGRATETGLREASRGKRILHVATHGFVEEDLLRGLRGGGGDGWASAARERQLAQGHDPMVLSGLALSGANARSDGAGGDGLLTALEASYLDLEPVELVTLSACETARGTAESGDGVLGLVHGFQLAGARHVMASLWKVDDAATRLLMERFYAAYAGAAAGASPARALREAARALRDLPGAAGSAARPYAAPRSWAAFVTYERR